MRHCEADIAQRMGANEMKVSTTITLDENEVRSLVALANIAYGFLNNAYEEAGTSPGGDNKFSLFLYNSKECESAFYMAQTIGQDLSI